MLLPGIIRTITSRPSNIHLIKTLFCNPHHHSTPFSTTSSPPSSSDHHPPVENSILSTKNCCREYRRNTSPGQDAYPWNSAIRGFVEGKNPEEAMLVYAHMRRHGVKADSYTIVFAVKACGLMSGGGVSRGEQTHGHVFKMGFHSEVIVQTALVKMYGLFEDLWSVGKVFDETPQRDMVLWNAVIATYAQRDHPEDAILVSRAMVDGGMRPNEMTAVSILSACSCLKDLEMGKSIHGYATKNLIGFDGLVYNALINMYAKCGCLSNARRLFEKMGSRDVVSWTSMINGYCDNNSPHEALALFSEMEFAGVRPDEVTMLGVVCMCGKLGSFELAEWVDDYIEKNRFGESTRMANALMDMHGKCGNIKRACWIFDHMKVRRTLVSWTTMIQILAMHGHGVDVLARFSQMQREGFRPDGVFFLSILSACSHAGLVEEGKQCFKAMTEEHGMAPWIEHHGSMVDLLCRAGLVSEAFEFLESMPMKPDVVMWRALIGACKDRGNIGLARRAMGRLLELEPEYSGNYILISNLFATIGEWDSVREVRREMGDRRAVKSDPACSLIEVNSDVSIV